jgi:hypothetical protein
MRNKNELQNQLNAHQSNRSNLPKNDHKHIYNQFLNSDDIYYAVLLSLKNRMRICKSINRTVQHNALEHQVEMRPSSYHEYHRP